MWKIYKILNYILIVIAALIVLFIILSILGNGINGTPWQVYIAGIVFLLMIFKSIINVYIHLKKFPDKLLIRQMLSWHIIAVLMNFISIVGFIIFMIDILREEFNTKDNADDNTGKIVFAVLTLIWMADSFAFYCQLKVYSFLKKNNKALFNSMIDSIGKE